MSFDEIVESEPEVEVRRRSESATEIDDSWECGAAAYLLGDRVGKGAFAEVYCATAITGARQGTPVAIKVNE